MRILYEQFRGNLTQRQSLCIKVGLVAVISAISLISAPADAQQPCPPTLTPASDETVVIAASECRSPSSNSGGLSDTPDYVDPVANVTLLGGRVTTHVVDSSALTTALADQDCGETLSLANGNFSSDRSISANCPANNPFIVTCANKHQCTATGTWTVTGAHNIITGMRFSGAETGWRVRGTNNKFIGNKLTGWRGNGIRPGNGNGSGPGTQAEIAYNEIYDPAPFEPDNGTTQFRMAMRMTTGGDGQSSSVHTKLWWHHNHIHDMPEKPDPSAFRSGQSDAMEPGESNYDWTPTFLCHWYIEDNLFDNQLQSGGGTTIDTKCGGTVIRRNTVTNSASPRLDIRFGSRSIVESNWLEAGGTNVRGSDHKIVCNHYTSGGSGIRIVAGNVAHNSSENAQPAAYNTLVAGNVGSLVVGHEYDGGSFAALKTTIEAHTGAVKFGKHNGTIDNRARESSYKCVSAVKLNSSEVGPAALSSASAAYRAARGL